MTGSFILSTLLALIHSTVPVLKGSFESICQFGVSVLGSLFNIVVEDIYAQNMILPLYSAGMTPVLVLVFICLYLYSIFKKESTSKKEPQFGLDESYRYLGCCEDDSWEYIKKSFIKRVSKRKNRDFYERYYLSYIQIFQNYQCVEVSFQTLFQWEKVKLSFFTMTNTIKNLLGAFAMPIYLSIPFMIVYYQNFTKTSLFTLEKFLNEFLLGRMFFCFMTKCYDIVMGFSIFEILNIYDKETAIALSFCIVMIVILGLYTIFTTRIMEIKRQFQRRMIFYFKKKHGIYDEKKKYSKSYLYGVQFTAFLFFVSVFMLYSHYNNFNAILSFLPEGKKDAAVSNLELREKIFSKVNEYALTQNDALFKGDSYTKVFMRKDSMVDLDKDVLVNYLEIYTYYTSKEAKESVKQNLSSIEAKLKTNKKKKFDYALSKKGFIIRDQGCVIIMHNDSSVLKKTLSEKELKNLMKTFGYKI